ncbi:hypothetical protein B0J17DRAFT_632769 [Rhizoctonia solani]|nr:hypothetical protein B0J17DRAFT_632769 [Rhizoctonia solani]
MSSNTKEFSPLRRTNITTTFCIARQGRLCRCSTCSSSFVSVTTISEVSTTSPPSEPNQSPQDLRTPSRARCAPLRVFANGSTNIESVYNYQDNSASAEESLGPNGCYAAPSQNPLNFPPARAPSLARSESTSSTASDQTTYTQSVKALRFNNNVSSNASVAKWAQKVNNAPKSNESAASSATVDKYEYEEAADFLPPLQAPGPSVRAQCLAPTRSNYNLTPTPAIPLGRHMNRKRF